MLIALKVLLQHPKQWERIFAELQELMDENKSIVELSRIGFPENWKDLLAE